MHRATEAKMSPGGFDAATLWSMSPACLSSGAKVGRGVSRLCKKKKKAGMLTC